MAKLKVYVHSLEPPTLGFVDKEGAQHACAQAQTIAFQGLQRLSGLFGNCYLTDQDRETLLMVEDFCRNNGLQFEVVDMGQMSFSKKLKSRMISMKTPAVCCQEQTFYGVPKQADLERLLKSA
jgi:hypothetical protein